MSTLMHFLTSSFSIPQFRPRHRLGRRCAASARSCSVAWTRVALTGLAMVLFAPSIGVAESESKDVDASQAAGAVEIHVYKTPTCGCCVKWIEHLEGAGFSVEATELASLDEVKAMNGVPGKLSSCHTALVGGYVIEGHVPASDVARLLSERPKVSGLAVPGMPMGSPGMEHRDPSRHEAYDVVSFGPDGTRVFSSHQP